MRLEVRIPAGQVKIMAMKLRPEHVVLEWWVATALVTGLLVYGLWCGLT